MNKNDKAIQAFGQVIKKYREQAKLTKQQLAYDADLSVNTIKRIEKGEYGITLHVLFSVAAALQVFPHLLIQEAEEVLQKGHIDVK